MHEQKDFTYWIIDVETTLWDFGPLHQNPHPEDSDGWRCGDIGSLLQESCQKGFRDAVRDAEEV